MPNYSKMLIDGIEREKNGIDFICPKADKEILYKLFAEINNYTGQNYCYLAELNAFNIHGSGNIVAKYISKFSSESVKSYLIPQIVADKTKDCDKLILQLYIHFKMSDEYISKPGKPAPAHIYVRYDNAFRLLKSKAIKSELVKLAYNPRDAFYLPLTMRMLASWEISELEEVFLSYLDGSSISKKILGLPEIDDDYYPSSSAIKRELKFTAINCLKFYSSDKVFTKLKEYSESEDNDIRLAINKILKLIK